MLFTTWEDVGMECWIRFQNFVQIRLFSHETRVLVYKIQGFPSELEEMLNIQNPSLDTDFFRTNMLKLCGNSALMCIATHALVISWFN